MTVLHPSLILKADLAKDEATDYTIGEIRRSYCHLAPITVTSHEMPDAPRNTMRMLVRLAKPYWHAGEAAEDDAWRSVLPWLREKVGKVATTMRGYNKAHEEAGTVTVEYDALEVEMRDVTFTFDLPSDGLAELVEDTVARYRALLVEGALRGAVARRVATRRPKTDESPRPAIDTAGEDSVASPCAPERLVWEVTTDEEAARLFDPVTGAWV